MSNSLHSRRGNKKRRRSGESLTRRSFLVLVGTGLLAGCQSPQNSVPTAARTPTGVPVLHPRTITPENADHVAQLAALNTSGGATRSVAWSPDSSVLAVADYSRVELWASKTRKQIVTLQGHSAQVNWLAWAQDGHTLASASDDGTIRLWNAQQQGPLSMLTTSSDASTPVLSIAWSPDGRRLISGRADGTVLVWDVGTGKPIELEGHLSDNPHTFAVWGVAWSPGGEQVAAVRYDGIVQVWDARTNKRLAILHPDDLPNCVAWSPDGRVLASTTDSGSVQLWDSQSYKNLATLLNHPDQGWAFAIAWSPDSSMLTISRRTGMIQLWDTQTGKELIVLQGHTAQVRGLSWSFDGRLIASGSDDATARLWGVV